MRSWRPSPSAPGSSRWRAASGLSTSARSTHNAIDPLVTIGAVLMVYLGGKATLWGPVLGAVLLVPAQQYLAYRLGASQLYLVGYAAVFRVVMLLLPRGILPSLAEKIRRRRGRADPGRPPAQVERPAKELVRSWGH